MKKIILLFYFVSCVLIVNAQETKFNSENPLVLFLVRHAEKVDNSQDAKLSLKGKERALTLAQSLKSAEIDFIHSTDFIRTRKTAQPLADFIGKEINIYNHSDLESFAQKLKESGGRHLIVGHSNTTPKLVELLGGDPGSPIDVKTEYDRLYVLSFSAEKKMNTVLFKFGDKY